MLQSRGEPMKALKCSKCSWIMRPDDPNFLLRTCERCNTMLDDKQDLIWIEPPLLTSEDVKGFLDRIEQISRTILVLPNHVNWSAGLRRAFLILWSAWLIWWVVVMPWRRATVL